MTQCLSEKALVRVYSSALPDKQMGFRSRAKPINNEIFAVEFFANYYRLRFLFCRLNVFVPDWTQFQVEESISTHIHKNA